MADAGGLEDEPAAAALALVRAHVRLRFTLTADEFIQHLLQRAGGAGAGRDPIPWLRLLRLDDLYLAQSCARRDEEAWAEFARLHFGFMREFASRFLSRADAADVTDRVVAELWERNKLERFEGRSSLRTWLGAVVAHAAMQAGKAIRRRQAESEQDSEALARVPGRAAAPEDEQAARFLAAITSEAIEALDDDRKLLLLLHYEQNLPLDRIAPILGTSKATLSRRLKQLREHLRATIERVAHEKYRASPADVEARIDLGRVELDLSLLLGGVGSLKGNRGDGV
jgi:RNA polymerase sigma-70 factor (ECF subfamily)